MVRQQFRKHMHETDPEKIQKLKDDGSKLWCFEHVKFTRGIVFQWYQAASRRVQGIECCPVRSLMHGVAWELNLWVMAR
ncbi:hypothetical protein L1049_016109 [Liquidambar formosana]|uniref:Complex 1 LYR protein domain-containing protein n=1 Tax=Liquidambar formosana TaxID=63359 RepID=A0AAP0S4N0_LIQFO